MKAAAAGHERAQRIVRVERATQPGGAEGQDDELSASAEPGLVLPDFAPAESIAPLD